MIETGSPYRGDYRPDERGTIIDDGEGIKKDDLPYVFDRYFTKRMNKNHVSGIGLSIVKQIALIHNAKYGVESELSKGTKFNLIFDK